MTAEALRPSTVDELKQAIAEATRTGRTLAIRGGASKRGVGSPEDRAQILDMTGFSGVIDYDPSELVLTAWAGTPLHEIESLLASKDQALTFEPFDHGPIFGRTPGAATLGGVVAAGVAGSARLTQGAARDHLLGFEAVSGRGERFVGGAKVVKNVTGYDLPKLMAGSWGRLAALTQVTLKVLPRPRAQVTKFVVGLDIPEAIRLMSAVMRSTAEVRSAAHIPCWPRHGGHPITALLLAGFPPSIEARSRVVDLLLAEHRQAEALSGDDSTAFWREIAVAAPLDGDRPLWRISLRSSEAARLGETLGLGPCDQLFDWGGGLVWVASDCDPVRLRAAVEAAGGQAMLVRAGSASRQRAPAFHPASPAVAALEERVRRAFDPLGVFETGRF